MFSRILITRLRIIKRLNVNKIDILTCIFTLNVFATEYRFEFSSIENKMKKDSFENLYLRFDQVNFSFVDDRLENE